MYFGVIIVIINVCLLFASYKKYRTRQWTYSLVFIMLCGLILRLFAGADCFLHKWDERYHALVSKNVMKHPLKPTLYDDPVLPYDHQDWSQNHVWLGKQPLPFWLMAGSMYLFGVNEIGLRIPSFILALLSIYLTYLIGSSLYQAKIGLIAAFFHAIHGMLIEVAVGRISSDHVDSMFLFFCELGIWLLILFHKRNDVRYLIMTGVSMGFAFMCKWIVAVFILMIFIGSEVCIERKWQVVFKRSCYILGACMMVCLPWQVYSLWQFPVEAKWMYSVILTPITQPYESQSGGVLYYIDLIRIVFGEVIYIPVIWIFI